MPKIKTSRAAAKRFKVTGTGKLKRNKAYKSHILTKKSAARMNGLSYSKFMYGLKLAGVEMNRKMLAEMAVNDAEGFTKLVEVAKAKLA